MFGRKRFHTFQFRWDNYSIFYQDVADVKIIAEMGNCEEEVKHSNRGNNFLLRHRRRISIDRVSLTNRERNKNLFDPLKENEKTFIHTYRQLLVDKK